MNDLKFDLNDIVIVPSEGSDVDSRSCCNPTTEFNRRNMLPLMASPMDTVVSSDNYKWFLINDIIPCLPRCINSPSIVA